MIKNQLITNALLFVIGLIGCGVNHQNIIATLLAIEVMLLSAGLNFGVFSNYLNDSYGEIFSIFILTVAATESAIGLAIFIIVYKLKGSISLNFFTFEKKH